MKFLVSKTYSRTTPESIDIGAYSDLGFVWGPTEYTFQELAELVLSREWMVEGDILTSGWYTVCYQTMTQEEKQLHVSCPSPRHQRAYQKLLRLKSIQ